MLLFLAMERKRKQKQEKVWHFFFQKEPEILNYYTLGMNFELSNSMGLFGIWMERVETKEEYPT